MSPRITQNCLKCVHFVRQIVYDRAANGTVSNIYRVQRCNRLNLQLSGTLSEEKSANHGTPQFVASICSGGRHFVPQKEIRVETIVMKEV
jgi:hypothetical protein